MTVPHPVAPLTRSAFEQAVITLERAFRSDPMFTWIFPDPERRTRALRHLNRVPLAYGLRYGHVTESHGARAVAIWIPPGPAISLGGMVRSGILPVPFRVGFRPFLTFARANQVMERIHHRLLPEPHWYLLIVGVDPELQGQGAGTALVKEGLARADQAGCPTYLETDEERNLPFYGRLGFRVVEAATLGPGGPPAWAMRRDPA